MFKIDDSNLIVDRQLTPVGESKDVYTGTKAFVSTNMMVRQFIPPPIFRNCFYKIHLNVILLSPAESPRWP
jgi:hypothetical protein